MTDKNAIWKWLVLLLAVTGSLIFVSPPSEKISLGIDLAGGTSFTLELDSHKVVEDIKLDSPNFTDADVQRELKRRMDGAQERALEVIRNRVDAIGGREPIIYPYKDNRIIVQLPEASEEDAKQAETTLKS
ncbi:MAG: preprotein translocase subunit SecD, partial [Kiritimatiellia bacterium]